MWKASSQRAKRKARVKAGICCACHEPTEPNPRRPGNNYRLCAKHRALQAERARKRIAKLRIHWRILGLCVVCGVRPSIKTTCPGETDARCGVCAEYQAEPGKRRKRLQISRIEPNNHSRDAAVQLRTGERTEMSTSEYDTSDPRNQSKG